MDLGFSTPSLLIAMPHLQDQDFWHAVVVLIEHNKEGAVGLIVNKPMNIPLQALIVIENKEIPANIPIWEGGPVGRNRGLILGVDALGKKAKAEIGKGIAISSSSDGLADFLAYFKRSPEEKSDLDVEPKRVSLPFLYPYRFLVGYAGWGPGQLERELRQGSWLQMSLNYDLLFNTPWQEMWELCMTNMSLEAANIAPVENAYLN